MFLFSDIRIRFFGNLALGLLFMSCVLLALFFGSQKPTQPVRHHYQAYQAPVENKQFSQITSPSEGSIKVYIDDQIGIVCIDDSSRLACVPQKAIRPKDLAMLRVLAKLQLERAAIAAAKKAAAKNAENARPRTSH